MGGPAMWEGVRRTPRRIRSPNTGWSNPAADDWSQRSDSERTARPKNCRLGPPWTRSEVIHATSGVASRRSTATPSIDAVPSAWSSSQRTSGGAASTSRSRWAARAASLRKTSIGSGEGRGHGRHAVEVAGVVVAPDDPPLLGEHHVVDRAVVGAGEGERTGLRRVGEEGPDDPAVHDDGHHLVGVALMDALEDRDGPRPEGGVALGTGDGVPALLELHRPERRVAVGGVLPVDA